MERKTVYFENIGPQNTEITFKSVKERLNESGIEKIVIASTTGATARMANDYFKDTGKKLIVIPHQYDFHRDVNPFPRGLVKELRDAGHDVHFGTMLFHTDQLYDSSIPTLIANILRCFCQGVKVCFEIVMMAADAGLVSKGEKVIAIAGTGRGAFRRGPVGCAGQALAQRVFPVSAGGRISAESTASLPRRASPRARLAALARASAALLR